MSAVSYFIKGLETGKLFLTCLMIVALRPTRRSILLVELSLEECGGLCGISLYYDLVTFCGKNSRRPYPSSVA